jgi:hypothetical protein
MASKTQIANLALSHIGVGKEIANLDTEKSEEAAACRRFYDTALEATLRDFAWPFSTKIQAMELVEEDPNDEWAYSYQYPSNCVKFRRILSGTRTDTVASRVPYKLAHGTSGQVIFSDVEDAQCEFTYLVSDASRYPPDFMMALSFRLAGYVAPRLTAGDPFKMGERAVRYYDYEISKARASAVNEEQPDVEADSSFITARE